MTSTNEKVSFSPWHLRGMHHHHGPEATSKYAETVSPHLRLASTGTREGTKYATQTAHEIFCSPARAANEEEAEEAAERETEKEITPPPSSFPRITRKDLGIVRTGMIDGRKVEFELMENLTQKPSQTRKQRLQNTEFVMKNAVPSRWDSRLRWWLMQWGIPQITLIYFVTFLSLNFLFAALWSIQDEKCCDDEAMKYSKVFDFAIQSKWQPRTRPLDTAVLPLYRTNIHFHYQRSITTTLASTTIGYGGYVPEGPFANFLVVMLSLTNLLLSALYSGLVFNKFCIPSAKTVFTDVMTLSNLNGIPCLELRVTNADGKANRLIDATARLTVTYALTHTDATGKPSHFANSQELSLLSNKQQQLDVLQWTLRHVIDETSPLFGVQFLNKSEAHIFDFRVAFNAVQENTGSMVYTQTDYEIEDILVGHRFEGMTEINRDDRKLVCDHSKLNNTEPGKLLIGF